MSQDKKHYKRKHYFVKKTFQATFILKFCLIILLGALLSTVLLFLLSQNTLTSSFHHSELTIKNTATAILPSIILTNLITLGLISLAAIVVILFISHKIAGPMFRLENDIKKIREGNLTNKIRLREKDQITDLADEINRMTDSYHEKILEIQTRVENLLQLAAKQNAPQELIEGLNHLKQQINNDFKI
jgi:methyl-accepting chemotaxis protein